MNTPADETIRPIPTHQESQKVPEKTSRATSNQHPRRGAQPSCGTCGAEWTGMLTCHCGGCHRTFAGLTAFDKHRRGGTCTAPETIGLVRNERKYECWGEPSDGTEWWPAS